MASNHTKRARIVEPSRAGDDASSPSPSPSPSTSPFFAPPPSPASAFPYEGYAADVAPPPPYFPVHLQPVVAQFQAAPSGAPLPVYVSPWQRQTTRVYEGYLRRKGIPRELIRSRIEPMAMPTCADMTMQGRRCQSAMAYRAVDAKRQPYGPRISCEAYCTDNCMAWLPHMLANLPHAVNYKRAGKWMVRPITSITLSVGSDDSRLTATLRRPPERMSEKVWFDKDVSWRLDYEAEVEPEYLLANQPRVLAAILCANMSSSGLMDVEVGTVPRSAASRRESPMRGRVSVYFDVAPFAGSRIFFGPPHAWTTEDEVHFFSSHRV